MAVNEGSFYFNINFILVWSLSSNGNPLTVLTTFLAVCDCFWICIRWKRHEHDIDLFSSICWLMTHHQEMVGNVEGS